MTAPPQPSAPRPHFTAPRAVVALALISVVMLPSVAWIVLDKRVFMWDQSWYGEVSSDLYYVLTTNISHWYKAMIAAMPSKPPMLVWLGQFAVPIGRMIGNAELAFLGLIVLAHSAALVIVWLAAGIMSPKNYWARVVAVLIVGGAPLFVGMSHQLVVEPLQVLCVAGSILLCLTAERLPLMALVSLLTMCVMSGFAIKTTSVAYCGLSWFYAFLVALRRLRSEGLAVRPRGYEIGLASIAIVLTIFTCHWYYTNFHDVLGHIRDATSGANAELYGRRDTFFAKLPFWLRESNNAIFVVDGVLWGLIGLAIAAVVLSFFSRRHREADDRRTLVALCIIQTVLPIAMLASQPPEETRYLVSVLPNVAVVAAWLLRPRRATPVAVALGIVLAAQLAVVNLQALGASIHMAKSAWLWVIDTDGSNRIVARDVVKNTCTPKTSNRINVIGPEFPEMNANSLSFLAAEAQVSTGYRCYYTSLGYAETDVEKAMRRIEDLKAEYVVLPRSTIEQAKINAFNQTLVKVQQRMPTQNDYVKVGEVGSYDLFKRLSKS